MYTIHVIAWAFATVLLGAFFVFSAFGWPGEFVGAGGMFCEALSASWIKQPANTWSNLGFVAAGLWMASQASAGLRVEMSAGNLFTRSRSMPIAYAALVISIGPGSMALHGSGHAWGHTVDVLAMLIYIMFPIAWSATRLFGGDQRLFWRIYLPLTVALAVPHTFGILPFSGIALYAVLIPTALALEAALHLRRPVCTRRRRFMLGAAGCFAIALLFWGLSLSDAPLCDPASLLQGHAAWHLLCAAATVFVFLAYAKERHQEFSR